MAGEYEEHANEELQEFERNWDEQIEDFAAMNLKEELLSGISDYGFTEPSPIQKSVISPIILGRDTIAQAQGSTGKTVAFAIAALQLTDPNIRECQVLILAPTREVAQAIQKLVTNLGKHLNFTSHACLGGTAVRDDIRKLSNCVQIVVGTPGRVNDMINRNALNLEKLKLFCLDEADEMLSRGFRDPIYEVFDCLPQDEHVQLCLFSSTMPLEILTLTHQFMNDPVKILVTKESISLDDTQQFFVNVEKEDYKLETLTDLYETLSDNAAAQTIIYCNTRRKVEWLTDQMEHLDFSVSFLHAEMSQPERETIIQQFQNQQTHMLISTDLVSKGSSGTNNIQGVSLVINYDLPLNRENYIHRVGRSGNQTGRKGVAINFVSEDDLRALREIETFYNTTIEELPGDVATLIGD